MGRVPRFGRDRNSVVGLDLGRHNIRMACVQFTDGRPALTAAGLTIAPAGVFATDGSLLGRDALADCLADLAADLGLSRSRVVTAIGGAGLTLFPLLLPRAQAVDPAAVRAAAVERLPLPWDQMVVTWQPGLAPAGESSDLVRRMVSAVPRQLADGLAAVLDRAGFEPVAIEAAPYGAVFSLVAARPSAGQREQRRIVGDWGAVQTTWSVLAGTELVAVAQVAGGGEALTEALAAAMGWDRRTADKAKRAELALDEGGDASDLTEAMAVVERHVQARVHPLLALLATETNPPAEILLHGGAARQPGLRERIETATGVPTRLADPFAWIDCGAAPSAISADGAGFALALGLAMRHETVEA